MCVRDCSVCVLSCDAGAPGPCALAWRGEWRVPVAVCQRREAENGYRVVSQQWLHERARAGKETRGTHAPPPHAPKRKKRQMPSYAHAALAVALAVAGLGEREKAGCGRGERMRFSPASLNLILLCTPPPPPLAVAFRYESLPLPYPCMLPVAAIAAEDLPKPVGLTVRERKREREVTPRSQAPSSQLCPLAPPFFSLLSSPSSRAPSPPTPASGTPPACSTAWSPAPNLWRSPLTARSSCATGPALCGTPTRWHQGGRLGRLGRPARPAG